MARLRRSEPEAPVDVVDVEPITPAARVDPRAVLMAPPEVQADPEALLRWAAKHLPWSIRSEAQASAHVDHRARHHAYTRARMEARRAGRPMPDPGEFFGDETHVAFD